MNTSTDKHWPSIRRAWIERRAARLGSINRKEISSALGISLAQVSEDLQELLRLHPGCLTYDLSVKTYHWTKDREPALPLPEWIGDLIESDVHVASENLNEIRTELLSEARFHVYATAISAARVALDRVCKRFTTQP